MTRLAASTSPAPGRLSRRCTGHERAATTGAHDHREPYLRRQPNHHAKGDPVTKLTPWRADFKNSPPTISRSQWDANRDLYVTVLAADSEDARHKVFEVAHRYLDNPFMDRLEEGSWA